MTATASELIEPVYAEHDFWSPATPKQTGWYFHWNGQENSPPIPTKVSYSQARKSSQVDAGQLGITKAISCADYGGLWAPLMIPPHGSAQEDDLKSRCIGIALQAMMEIKKNKTIIFSTFDIKNPKQWMALPIYSLL